MNITHSRKPFPLTAARTAEAAFYLTALLCMLFFVFLQPFGEGPDEINRFRIVSYICSHGSLPSGFDPAVIMDGYGTSYAFQPILPYILMGFLLRFLKLFTSSASLLLVAARLVNVCFGLATAFFVRRTARLLFPDALTGWLFSFLAVFLPQSIFLHTYVNPDSMAMMGIAMLVYALLAGLADRFSRRSCLLLAGGIILCALSYYNSYGFILAAVLLFAGVLWKAHRAPEEPGAAKVYWKKGLLISLLVLAGIGWWFLRNGILYQGDILGLATSRQCAVENATLPELNPALRQTYYKMGESVWAMIFGTDWYTLVKRSFVAMFGPMNIPTHVLIYTWYNRLFAAGLIGMFLPAVLGPALPRLARWQKRWANICLALACLITIALAVAFSYFYDFQPQGRYLLPMLLPFSYFVTLGLSKWIGLVKLGILKTGAGRKHPSAGKGIFCLLHAVLLLFILTALLYSVFAVMVPYYREAALPFIPDLKWFPFLP